MDWYLFVVYLLHIIVFTPIMIYIGQKKTKTEINLYKYLKILGIIGLIYHSTALLISIIIGKWTWEWII